MNSTVVEEKIDLILVAYRCPNFTQECLEFLLVKRVLLDYIREDPVTFADSSTYRLAWLIPCTIFHCNVLIRARPSLLLVASCLEYTLVGEDEVTPLADDLVHLVSQLYGLIGVLFIQLILLLWHIFSLDLLELEAIELKYLTVMHWLNDSIRKLSMEQLPSFCETQMRLITYCVWFHKIYSLLFRHISKGHSL